MAKYKLIRKPTSFNWPSFELNKVYDEYAKGQNGCIVKECAKENPKDWQLVSEEIIGYKLIKPEYEKVVAKVLQLSSSHTPNIIIASMISYYIPKIEELGIMDWFEPVYKPILSLPVINGYEGICTSAGDLYSNTIISYGCAVLNVGMLNNVYKAIVSYKAGASGAGNRSIKSIKLDSNVEITMDQIKQIIDYVDNN